MDSSYVQHLHNMNAVD